MAKLMVKLDSVAALRQLGRTPSPDPVESFFAAQKGGAAGVSMCLREDHGPVSERDLRILKEVVTSHLNVEIEPTQEMLKMVLDVKPHSVTLVGASKLEGGAISGLDVTFNQDKVSNFVALLREAQIEPRVFIKPDLDQVRSAHRAGAVAVEISSWSFTDAVGERAQQQELSKVTDTTKVCERLHMRVHIGGGLHFQNIASIVQISEVYAVKVGHSIVARALDRGLQAAVRDMVRVLEAP